MRYGNDHHLVAAVPVAAVLRQTEDGHHIPADKAENPVSVYMAVGVVDVLEGIDVEESETDLL